MPLDFKLFHEAKEAQTYNVWRNQSVDSFINFVLDFQKLCTPCVLGRGHTASSLAS